MGRNRWKLDKSQRMQLKALISVLGLLLLVILSLGQLLKNSGQQGEEPETHIPVMERFSNVWLMEADEKGILIFRDGVEEYYTYPAETQREEGDVASIIPAGGREQLADVELTDGCVTGVCIKDEKINGKILSVTEDDIEVEGYGKIPLAQDYKGYRLYKSLTMCAARDLRIGYNFADLVVENGTICGILIVKEEAMEAIRVLLKRGDYDGLLHEQVVLSSDSDFVLEYGTYDNLIQEQYAAGDEVTIDMDSAYFSGERIVIRPDVLTGKIKLLNVNRSQGIPAYRGQIELRKTAEGIAVINQVLLEEYLYCVVPSEMPASYPEEALKAQAICARTYAYGHMLNAGYLQYGAHVDDSTSYQVYNNILEQESTTTAVKETYGQLLYTKDGALAGTYYYSTSCGVGSDANVWKTEAARTIDYLHAKYLNPQTANAEDLETEEKFAEFIRTKNVEDFEVTEGWYRWNYTVSKLDAEKICGILQKRYAVNPKLVLTYDGENFVEAPIEQFSEIQDMYVAKRGAGGIADELHIVTKEKTYKVITEHNIRYLLNNGESMIVRQDGSKVASPGILPSAFFVIDVVREKDKVTGYTLTGGGFGHGVGMSQNGAKQMAKKGYTVEDILLFFYDGCMIENVYEDRGNDS